jgi:hypothetical protein
MKKLEIISIADRKAKKRGIPEEWIEETVNAPDQVVDGYGGRRVAQKIYAINDKEFLLRVVCEEKEGVFVVVTAYLTSHLKRYREGVNEN